MRIVMVLVILGLAACDQPKKSGTVRVENVADVKTCGCPKRATCGDCCGKDDCRCSPN